ncbi:ATP-dependent Clp protease proteolytic subunit [bacterium]|nr:ATP-dependent Clp protease proteolytic subunit [bacterium]
MAERNQDPSTRKELFRKIEKELERPVVSFFTSFNYPVIIDDSDADLLEGLLQSMDLSNGLALLISSPGGSGTAAERIINVCRSYSGTGEFWAIVPGKAKSAATMICLGASKVFMGPASELGPVDPQIITNSGSGRMYISAYHIVITFDRLFKEATSQEGGKIEPYIQQLAKYDASQIEHLRSAIELAEDISVKALQSGMMKEKNYDTVKEKIDMLLTPETTKAHGRPIFRDTAKSMGLNIKELDTLGNIGRCIYELYIRSKYFTDDVAAKLIESQDDSMFVSRPKED